MTRQHTAYTRDGRQGLRRVVDYERRRFGMVRGTVADRIMTGLEDVHATPALHDPEVFSLLNKLAHEMWNGNVGGVAIHSMDLMQRARDERDRLREVRRLAVRGAA